MSRKSLEHLHTRTPKQVPSGKSYKLQSYTSPCVILVHEGVGSAVHEDDDEIVLQEGMVFLLPAGQTATIRATPHMPIRLFSARCRESLYDEEEEEEEESSKEEKVDTGMILSPPSISDLEESRAFRPIEAPLWCVATCTWCSSAKRENLNHITQILTNNTVSRTRITTHSKITTIVCVTHLHIYRRMLRIT